MWSGPNNRNTVSGAADQSCGYWGNNTGSDSLGWQERRGIQRIMGEDRWRNKELPERQKVKRGMDCGGKREGRKQCVRVSDFDQSSAYLSLSGLRDPVPFLTTFFFVSLWIYSESWLSGWPKLSARDKKRDREIAEWVTEWGKAVKGEWGDGGGAVAGRERGASWRTPTSPTGPLTNNPPPSAIISFEPATLYSP